MKQSFLRCFIVLALCFGWAFILPHCGKEKKEPLQALAPNFSLKTIQGEGIALSNLRGKVVLLDFWATWCGPCRESIPHLVNLYKTYQKNGFEVIGMNVDRGDMEAVSRFVKSMDIPYPIALTPEDVERNYGVTGLPTTIFIDKEGKIRDKMVGFNSEIAKMMSARVVDLTSEKP